jgi:hypothetical protein
MTTWALRILAGVITFAAARAIGHRYADVLDEITTAIGGR